MLDNSTYEKDSLTDRQTDKDLHVVLIRFIAILLVLLGHSFEPFYENGVFYINSGELYNPKWMHIVGTFIYTFHMPLFMSISGWLFYYEVKKSRDVSSKFLNLAFLKKKIWRLIIPFILMMYVWRKPLSYLIWPGTVPQTLREYIKFGTTGPLWYLYVLFGIFCIQKVLMWLLWKDRKSTFIALGVFSVIGYSGYFFQSTLRFMMIYSFYFYLGAYLHYERECHINSESERQSKINILLLTILGIVLTTVHVGCHFDEEWFSNLILFLSAVIDVVAAWKVIENYRIAELPKGILKVDNHGMGIYLFQTEIMALIARVCTGFDNYFIVWIITFLAGLIGSYLLTDLVRKMHLTALIGEYRPKKLMVKAKV